ncbi:MAG: hypothetical protein JNM57_14050 [Cyclobacteriaceae bacterium]|nr:hypothetical protein [Cyclobacteriaceae bacterium]
MKKFGLIVLVILAGCSGKPSKQEQPSLNGLCGFLTKAEIEAVLGRALDEEPVEINEDYLGGKGCSYSAGLDTSGNAYFAYVVVPDQAAFEKNKSDSETVGGVGDEAYRFNGPDAEQLWVREGNHFVMVAIGDVPNLAGAKKLALLVLSRLK